MPLETAFCNLTVSDDCSTSSIISRKRRRLSAPSSMSTLPQSETIKRSSVNRQLLRHSHHGGDRLLRSFYKEVAPGLTRSRPRRHSSEELPQRRNANASWYNFEHNDKSNAAVHNELLSPRSVKATLFQDMVDDAMSHYKQSACSDRTSDSDPQALQKYLDDVAEILNQ